MRKIYIIARSSALSKQMRAFLRQVTGYYCRKAMEEGALPFAPALYFSDILGRGSDDQRMETQICEEVLEEVDECWVVMIDGKTDDKMKREIVAATKLNKISKLYWRTAEEIKEEMRGAS